MPTSVADWEWEFKVNENSHFGHSYSQYFQKFEYPGLEKKGLNAKKHEWFTYGITSDQTR